MDHLGAMPGVLAVLRCHQPDSLRPQRHPGTAKHSISNSSRRRNCGWDRIDEYSYRPYQSMVLDCRASGLRFGTLDRIRLGKSWNRTNQNDEISPNHTILAIVAPLLSQIVTVLHEKNDDKWMKREIAL